MPVTIRNNRALNGSMCSAGIAVSTAFRLHSVSAWQKNGRRNIIILMATFEELILIGIFCFVILENEVNSLIVTLLLLVNFS